MEPLKKDAINIITNMPDDADMEEIMYRLYVLENIRRGQEDAESCRSGMLFMPDISICISDG